MIAAQVGNTQAPSASQVGEQIRARVECLSFLPTTVGVAMKLVELRKDPKAGANEYAKIIASDASLCTKVLALANSSWFGVRNKVTKPLVAVNLLGLGTVRTLAINTCLTGLHHELRLTPEEARRLWAASLCKAVAAKQFAWLNNATVADEAFAAGLMQDLALPILYACARTPIGAMLEDVGLDVASRLRGEQAICDLDHMQLGDLVAKRLQLPELFGAAVAHHHDLEALRSCVGEQTVASAVYAASLFPHMLNGWNPADAAELRSFFDKQTGGRSGSFEQYLETVQTLFASLYRYFDGGSAPEARLMELLTLATREAADSAIEMIGALRNQR